jgi:hypothetical protein
MATEAYKDAGYSHKNMLPATVYRKAIEVLQNGNVAARISKLRGDLYKKDLYELQTVLDEYGKVAFFNIIDIFDFVKVNGKITLAGGAKKIHEKRFKIGSKRSF